MDDSVTEQHVLCPFWLTISWSVTSSFSFLSWKIGKRFGFAEFLKLTKIEKCHLPSFFALVKLVICFLPWCNSKGGFPNPVCTGSHITYNVLFTLQVISKMPSKMAIVMFLLAWIGTKLVFSRHLNLPGDSLSDFLYMCPILGSCKSTASVVLVFSATACKLMGSSRRDLFRVGGYDNFCHWSMAEKFNSNQKVRLARNRNLKNVNRILWTGSVSFFKSRYSPFNFLTWARSCCECIRFFFEVIFHNVPSKILSEWENFFEAGCHKWRTYPTWLYNSSANTFMRTLPFFRYSVELGVMPAWGRYRAIYITLNLRYVFYEGSHYHY